MDIPTDDKSKLEKILAFARNYNISAFDICNLYSKYKAMDIITEEDLAYTRTMEWIYLHS